MIVLFVLMVSGVYAQQQNVHLSGTVTEGPAGFPVGDQPVNLTILMGNDSLNVYAVSLFTNASGYYAYSFFLAGGVICKVDVSTPDCNGVMLTETVWVIPGSTSTVDFNICANTGGCLSQFTNYPDSAYLAYQFMDLSSGAIDSWTWDFGDGTTSSQQNPLHIFPGEGEYEVCLAISGPDCQSTWCQVVTVGFQGDCFNYFTYQSSGTALYFQGYHSTSLPAFYAWNFGDGNTGEGQSVVHTYAANGTYYVTLSTYDSINCAAFSGQVVVAGDTIIFHQVWGQVFAGNFPISGGQVMIFSTPAGQGFIPYNDIVNIDANGVFVFSQVPAGEFVLQAIPPEGQDMMPTYFGDVLHWNDATRLVPGQASNPCNIRFMPSLPAVFTGNGSISGDINQTFTGLGLMEKIKVLLFDQDYQSMGFTGVTPQGGFHFDGLVNGTYYLYPELAGTGSSFIRVDITDLLPEATVVLSFNGNSILDLPERDMTPDAGMIFPNPAATYAAMIVNTAAPTLLNTRIIDLCGSLKEEFLFFAQSGENRVEIPLSSLAPGVYIVMIVDGDGRTAARKFVRH